MLNYELYAKAEKIMLRQEGYQEGYQEVMDFFADLVYRIPNN